VRSKSSLGPLQQMPNAENGNLNIMGSIVLQDRTIPKSAATQNRCFTPPSQLQDNPVAGEFETPVTYWQ